MKTTRTATDIPAAAESGVLPGYDVTTWYGVFAPRGTPPAVVAKLNKTLNEILAGEAVRQRLATAGVLAQGSTPGRLRQADGRRVCALGQGARLRARSPISRRARDWASIARPASIATARRARIRATSARGSIPRRPTCRTWSAASRRGNCSGSSSTASASPAWRRTERCARSTKSGRSSRSCSDWGK